MKLESGKHFVDKLEAMDAQPTYAAEAVRWLKTKNMPLNSRDERLANVSHLQGWRDCLKWLAGRDLIRLA